MDLLPLMRELWHIREAVDRIETKMEQPKRGLLDDKVFLLIAGLGISLLIPADKQQALLALLQR